MEIIYFILGCIGGVIIAKILISIGEIVYDVITYEEGNSMVRSSEVEKKIKELEEMLKNRGGK